MDYSYLNSWQKRALERANGRGKSLSFLLKPFHGTNDIVFDLHTHSTSSDGMRTPEKLGNDAKENGLAVLSITDHDTIQAYDKLLAGEENLGKFDGKLISGVEISSKLNGKAVEVLLYDFDIPKLKELENKKEFPFLNRKFKQRRILDLISQRIKIVNSMKLTDKPLTIDDFVSIETTNAEGKEQKLTFAEAGLKFGVDVPYPSDESGEVRDEVKWNGEMHKINFDFFNSKLFRYISSSEKGKEFFNSYTQGGKPLQITSFAEFNRNLIQRKDSPLYVDDSAYWPTVEQVSDLAKNTDGVAIMAHPYGYSLGVDGLDLAKEALEAGVDGIEVMHGFNEAEQVEKLYKFAYENNLFISAGSDSHEFYSSQGNKWEPGTIPSQGVKSKYKNNVLEESKIGTYNLHNIGSGKWRGAESFSLNDEIEIQMQ